MASRPTTPRRRRPSSIEFSDASPTSRFAHHSRHSSTTYSQQHSPVSRRFSHGPDDTVDTSGLGAAGDDLGNLADELADAGEWGGEEDEADETLDDAAGDDHDSLGQVNGGGKGRIAVDTDKIRDSGIDVSSSPSTASSQKHGSLSLPPDNTSPRDIRRQDSSHRRLRSYDGSDYGDEDDFEQAPSISKALEAQMAAVEGLARRGIEANGSADDKIIERVVDQLKDLGSQAAVEGGATRLSTAHSAVATHLAHQTRQLASLLTTLISPLAAPPPPDLIDELQPLFDPLRTCIADLQPTGTPLHAIHTLNRSTSDLVSTLSYLADTLQMSRQTTTTAARRLRTVREAMAEWKRESDATEEGVRFIERGGWDRRLAGREAGQTCQTVVGGFEEACERWREKLVGQLGVEVVA